jgi:hypothetical protein
MAFQSHLTKHCHPQVNWWGVTAQVTQKRLGLGVLGMYFVMVARFDVCFASTKVVLVSNT